MSQSIYDCIYNTFLSCLTVSTITRILQFLKSIFIVWNSHPRFSRGFLCSSLLGCKNVWGAFSATKQNLFLLAFKMQYNGGTAVGPLLGLGARNPKNSLKPGHSFISHHTFPINISFVKKKSLMFTCTSLLLTTDLYS